MKRKHNRDKCPKCGAIEHLNYQYPHPNPVFRLLKNTTCLRCKRSLIGNTHDWKYKDTLRFICCDCYCWIRDHATEEDLDKLEKYFQEEDKKCTIQN